MAELVDATDLTNIVDILILLKFVSDSVNGINPCTLYKYSSNQRIEELSTTLKQNSKCFLNRKVNLNYVQAAMRPGPPPQGGVTEGGVTRVQVTGT